MLVGNPCLVQVGLVLNDGLVLAVPACQYITTCSSVGGGPAEAMPLLAAGAGAWSDWSAPEASRSARRLAASIANQRNAHKDPTCMPCAACMPGLSGYSSHTLLVVPRQAPSPLGGEDSDGRPSV